MHGRSRVCGDVRDHRGLGDDCDRSSTASGPAEIRSDDAVVDEVRQKIPRISPSGGVSVWKGPQGNPLSAVVVRVYPPASMGFPDGFCHNLPGDL